MESDKLDAPEKNQAYVVIHEAEGTPVTAFVTDDRTIAHEVLAECEQLPAFEVAYTLMNTTSDREAFMQTVKENLV